MFRLYRWLKRFAQGFAGWQLRREALWLIAIWLVIVAIRFIGPFNLADQDQERPAAYMMDVLRNNEWLCQRDTGGDITSKPPLYTWLGAICSFPFGAVNRFSLYLPCMLSVLACALLILRQGGKHFGRAAGFWGGVALLASLPAVKMVSLARTDPLFMLVVFGAGLVAFECWTNRRSWAQFWLLVALATLTKGPLGVVLGALGLLAIVWERLDKRAPVGDGLRLGEHLEGLFAYVVLCAGWFWLAVRELGQPVIDKMLGAELSRHIVKGDAGELPFANVFNPFCYFLGRFIPWSLFALGGATMAVRRPSAGDNTRRFERFCVAALFGGIILFSMAGHKRPDHLFPLYPFAAILAGRALAWLREREKLRLIPVVAMTVMLCYSAVYYIVLEQKEEKVLVTKLYREFADTVKSAGNPPLVYMTDPQYGVPSYSFQFFLNQMSYEVATTTALRLLDSPTPVMVAVAYPDKTVPLLRDGMTTPSRLHVMTKRAGVGIVSNQSEFRHLGRMASTLWDVDIVTSNAVVSFASRRHEIAFSKTDEAQPARVSVGNFTAHPRELQLHIFGRKETMTLAPGETWSATVR